ncbi:MAG: hypothetical protein IPN46_09400 [Saprospiraceae bacterium]|nr:hypothetical protein [Saprospiraceae bacterium]
MPYLSSIFKTTNGSVLYPLLAMVLYTFIISNSDISAAPKLIPDSLRKRRSYTQFVAMSMVFWMFTFSITGAAITFFRIK